MDMMETFNKNMQKQSVFGCTGYIGTRYMSKYVHDCVGIYRGEQWAKSDNILYFISTTDNYNIHNFGVDGHLVDIDTNLRVLMEVLYKFHIMEGEDSKKTFNFISSWFVYGDTDLPAKEDSYCNPKGFYSITKRTAEQLIISYCETFGINYRILRLANVVGDGAPFSVRKNALEYMIDQLHKGEPVKLYDNGNLYRDFIHVDDCVRAINLVVTEGEKNTIYNIGNGTPVRLVDAIVKAKTLLNSTSEILPIFPPEFHKIVQVKSMYMDNKKLTELGYVPRYSGLAIIEKLIQEKQEKI